LKSVVCVELFSFITKSPIMSAADKVPAAAEEIKKGTKRPADDVEDDVKKLKSKGEENGGEEEMGEEEIEEEEDIGEAEDEIDDEVEEEEDGEGEEGEGEEDEEEDEDAE